MTYGAVVLPILGFGLLSGGDCGAVRGETPVLDGLNICGLVH